MNCAEGKTHHWRLEEPNGHPFVPGTCRNCGAEKMHKVTIVELDRSPAHGRELTIHHFRPSISRVWISREW